MTGITRPWRPILWKVEACGLRILRKVAFPAFTVFSFGSLREDVRRCDSAALRAGFAACWNLGATLMG